MTDGEIARDRWGRPLIMPMEHLSGGKPIAYTRCSTYAKSISDSTALMTWKERQVVKGLAMAPHLLDPLTNGSFPYGGYGNPALDAVIEQATEMAGSHDAARVGTAIHGLTEWIEQGVAFDRDHPEFAPFMPYVDAYMHLIGSRGITTIDIEQFVVNDTLLVAGTYDRLYRLSDGRVVIGDIKTGSATADNPHETAIQEAVYAHSRRYDMATGTRSPIHPDIDRTVGVLVHIPSKALDKAGIYLLDLEAGWQAALLGRQVREWRKTKIIQPLDMTHVEETSTTNPEEHTASE